MTTERPLLRVVRGDPTDEELAALTVVLAAVAGRKTAADTPTSRSSWSDRSAVLRRPLHAGPGAWRNSAMPGRPT